MLITVKYFGMLTEQTHKQEETLTFESQNNDIQSLETSILHKYPELKKMSYNIALNQNIVAKTTVIHNGDELAFLPPFAGG